MTRRVRWFAMIFLSSAMLAAPVAPTAQAGTAAPVITTFSPTSGPVGTKVIIHGSGFSPGPVSVTFNGVNAPNPKVNGAGTAITVAVPAFATTGPIAVYTSDGAGFESSAPFTVTFGATRSPAALWAGQKMRISGSAYPSYTDVTFSIGGTVPLGGTATDANGNFSVLRTIPQLHPSKTLMMVITCPTANCATVYLPFSLFGDWAQERFDATQSGRSNVEWLIKTGNAAGLHRKYSFGGATVFTTNLVEMGGRVYVGQGYNNWGEVLSRTISGSSALAHYVTARYPAGIAVAGGVLYAVTWETLYAFDAKAVNNCSGPWSNRDCTPLWTANLGTGAYPFPPVLADGKVFLSEFGRGALAAFDASGTVNCSGSPKVCTPLWSKYLTGLLGPPAVSPVSDGGTGKVYVAATSSSNRVVAYDEAGTFQGQSPPIPGTQLSSGPALAGGKVAVTLWTSASSTATLSVLDASSLALLWSSIDLGGSSPPSAPAIGGAKVYVANSSGRLLAFDAAGCGSTTCAPLWRSGGLGPGNSIAPILANGVVYHAANANSSASGLDLIYAFDAAGNLSCSGSPKICTPLATLQSGYSDPGVVGNPGGLALAAGTLYGVGPDEYVAYVP